MDKDIQIDQKDNIRCFYDDMYQVIMRHEHENELSPATFIGVIELLKNNYIREYQESL